MKANTELILTAIDNLQKSGESIASQVRKLVKFLSHRRLDVKIASLKALGELGKRAYRAYPSVNQMLSRAKCDKQEDLLMWLCSTIVKISPTEVARDTLYRTIVRSRGSEKICAACHALSAVGGSSAEGPERSEAIVRMQKHTDEAVQQFGIMYAFARWDPRAVRPLRELASRRNHVYRQVTAKMLRRHGYSER